MGAPPFVKARAGPTLITAFPDIELTVEQQVAEGDSVVTRFRVWGTFRDELAGAAPTGRSVTVPVVVISRVANGKIVEDFEVWDQLTMFEELGALSAIAAHT